MSEWSSTRARRVLAGLLRMRWTINRNPVSPYTFPSGWPDFVFAFHDNEELGLGCLPELQNGRASALKTCRSYFEKSAI